MARRDSSTVEATSFEEMRNPFLALLADPSEERWQEGWRNHRDRLMREALDELHAKPDPSCWGYRPVWYWAIDLGIAPPLDDQERLRLLLEQGELRDSERERIRRLADEARRRFATDGELFSGERGSGHDGDAVRLGALLEELEQFSGRF
jgi:hypothetical protein